MQPMVSGGLLVAAFVAIAGLALAVVFRLCRVSQPDRPRRVSEPGQRGEPPDA